MYPFVFVASASISYTQYLARQEIWLYPRGINFNAYRRVLNDPMLLTSYRNTLWQVAVGTTINLFMTTTLAYSLSRRNFSGRRFLMMAVVFTMFFSGGMIPTYMIVRSLGLLNTLWALVIPTAISTWNLIVTRSFFDSVPESYHEAATIDGAGEFRIFSTIILPLSKPILATMVLFYAVAHWNSFFNALLYINREHLFPLQIFLRRILIQYEASDMMVDVILDREAVGLSIRYAAIIISTVPILCVYPFLQKYFVKGVMIGGIKG